MTSSTGEHVYAVCRGCGGDDSFTEHVVVEGRQAGRILTDQLGALIFEGDQFIEHDAKTAKHVAYRCEHCGKEAGALRDLVRLVHDHAV